MARNHYTHLPPVPLVDRPKLDEKGRVVIPVELRETMDLKPGQEFVASEKNGVLLLVPVVVSVAPRDP